MSKPKDVLNEDGILNEVKETIVEPLNEGRIAFVNGKEPKHNPYKQKAGSDSGQHMAWFIGFMEAMYIHHTTKKYIPKKEDEE